MVNIVTITFRGIRKEPSGHKSFEIAKVKGNITISEQGAIITIPDQELGKKLKEFFEKETKWLIRK